MAESGWDNRTFRLGDGMVARLPSVAEYALAVDKEQRWLPVLAPRLPLPVPVPLAKGRPGAGYPFSWSVLRWLDGEPACADRIPDPVRFALDLSGFLVALRNLDAADGPRPGKHNWFRGATLRTFDPLAERALTALDGDVAPGNLLLDGGRLAAVIDFGTCGVGDPSCDLAIAWTLLTADGREAFRERLSVDTPEWERGRGWALWKTLVTCARTKGRADDEAVNARRVLAGILAIR